MAMKQLHFEALEMMERVRARLSEFWYGTRVRNSPQSDKDKIAEGYVFLGNKTYIWIPICPISIPENNTKAVGVVFKVDKQHVLTDAYLEIVVPEPDSRAGKTDPKLHSYLKGLAGSLKGPLRKSRTKYNCYRITIPTGGNVIQSVEQWLNANLPTILKHLTGFTSTVKPHTMVYTRQIMASNIDRFLKARGPVNDATSKKLQVVRSKI